MKTLIHTTLTILALSVFTCSASAGTFDLSGPIDVFQAGTNGSFGTGSGNGSGTISGSYDDVANLLDYSISWQDLTGTVSNMHFHNAPAGSSSGVALGIPGPWASPQIGSGTLSASDETDLLAGNWYVNIHTSSFGGGEIRGQVRVTSVPEPTIAGLGIFAMTGLVLRRRR